MGTCGQRTAIDQHVEVFEMRADFLRFGDPAIEAVPNLDVIGSD
jgi:hypothetical protein